MAEVATTKLFENDKIIVWEMILEPGESTGMHTHYRDYMFYVLESAKLDVFDAQGQLLFHSEHEPGSVSAPRLVDGEFVDGDKRVPATHEAKNVGETRFREILIEMK